MISLNTTTPQLPLIGVGLRHIHYNDALSARANIDFIEVHAENFFAEGGATYQVITDIAANYPISLHATSLGLGSAVPAPEQQLNQLLALVERTDPILVSDHACFSWAELSSASTHAGDLLPVPFNEESLACMANNVLRAQALLKRTILVENLSAYMQLPGSTYSESEFLVKLCELTGCKLLIDINNLMVNAANHHLLEPNGEKIDTKEFAKQWLNSIPKSMVGEFHLAGCTSVPENDFMIDDHSQPVSDDAWQVYKFALERFGPVPTLIEWDENLPSWTTLLKEADKARQIATKVFSREVREV